MASEITTKATGSMLARAVSYITEGDHDMPALDIIASHAMKLPESSISADVKVEPQAADTALTPDQLAKVDQLATVIMGIVFRCDQCDAKKSQQCSGFKPDARRSVPKIGLHMYGGDAKCSPNLTEAGALCMRPDAYPKEINVSLPVSSTPQT